MGETYDHVRNVTDKQIAKEQAVHNELDELEIDVFGLWEDHFEIPYGSKFKIRVRAELPRSYEQRILAQLTGEKTEDSDAETIELLSAMTMGLYADESLIRETDKEFWENLDNWNTRRVEAILMAYLTRMKKETEQIYSFLGEKTE